MSNKPNNGMDLCGTYTLFYQYYGETVVVSAEVYHLDRMHVNSVEAPSSSAAPLSTESTQDITERWEDEELQHKKAITNSDDELFDSLNSTANSEHQNGFMKSFQASEEMLKGAIFTETGLCENFDQASGLPKHPNSSSSKSSEYYCSQIQTYDVNVNYHTNSNDTDSYSLGSSSRFSGECRSEFLADKNSNRIEGESEEFQEEEEEAFGKYDEFEYEEEEYYIEEEVDMKQRWDFEGGGEELDENKPFEEEPKEVDMFARDVQLDESDGREDEREPFEEVNVEENDQKEFSDEEEDSLEEGTKSFIDEEERETFEREEEEYEEHDERKIFEREEEECEEQDERETFEREEEECEKDICKEIENKDRYYMNAFDNYEDDYKMDIIENGVHQDKTEQNLTKLSTSTTVSSGKTNDQKYAVNSNSTMHWMSQVKMEDPSSSSSLGYSNETNSRHELRSDILEPISVDTSNQFLSFRQWSKSKIKEQARTDVAVRQDTPLKVPSRNMYTLHSSNKNRSSEVQAVSLSPCLQKKESKDYDREIKNESLQVDESCGSVYRFKKLEDSREFDKQVGRRYDCTVKIFNPHTRKFEETEQLELVLPQERQKHCWEVNFQRNPVKPMTKKEEKLQEKSSVTKSSSCQMLETASKINKEKADAMSSRSESPKSNSGSAKTDFVEVNKKRLNKGPLKKTYQEIYKGRIKNEISKQFSSSSAPKTDVSGLGERNKPSIPITPCSSPKSPCFSNSVNTTHSTKETRIPVANKWIETIEMSSKFSPHSSKSNSTGPYHETDLRRGQFQPQNSNLRNVQRNMVQISDQTAPINNDNRCKNISEEKDTKTGTKMLNRRKGKMPSRLPVIINPVRSKTKATSRLVLPAIENPREKPKTPKENKRREEKTSDSERKNYKPYTMKDYRNLRLDLKLGGLGPQTEKNIIQEKLKKYQRQASYAQQVMERNRRRLITRFDKPQEKDSTKDNLRPSSKTARRQKALEYAKKIRSKQSNLSTDREEKSADDNGTEQKLKLPPLVNQNANSKHDQELDAGCFQKGVHSSDPSQVNTVAEPRIMDSFIDLKSVVELKERHERDKELVRQLCRRGFSTPKNRGTPNVDC